MSIVKQIYSTFKEHGLKLILLLIMLASIMSPLHVYIKDVLSIILLCLVAKGPFNKTFLQLLLFSFFYFLFAFLEDSSNLTELFSYLLCPVTFYLLGQRISKESTSEENLMNVFILITIAANIVLWTNSLSDSVQHGVINVGRIIENDSQREISATLQGLLLSIGISGIAYVIVSGSFLKWRSLVMLCFSLLSLFCTIHLVSRTGIGIFVIAIIVAMLYMFRGGKAYVILSITTLYVIYLLLTHYGIINADVFEAYEARAFNQNTAGGRTEIWISSLAELINNPLGWEKIELGYSKGFCHNLWLDVARRTGWIPFIILLFITFKKLFELSKLALHSQKPFVGYFTALMICVLTTCFLEPVIEGVSIYFYFLCFLWGIQSDLSNKNCTNEKNSLYR